MSAPTVTRQTVLRGAADILQINGRCFDVFYDPRPKVDPSHCPLCVLGAIALTAGCDLATMELDDPVTPAEVLAIDAARALADHLELPGPTEEPMSLVLAIGDWHDGLDALTPPTTEEVLAVLAATADALDEQES